MDKKEPQSVNINELARRVNKLAKRRILVKDADKTIQLMLIAIAEALDNGEVVKLGKYAKLSLEDKQGHIGYNGITKEHYQIPDKRVVKLQKLSKLDELENKDIKDQVNTWSFLLDILSELGNNKCIK